MRAALLALLLAGCAQPFYTSMSPEQLAALAKFKEANLICVQGVYAGAVVRTTSISTDKGIVGTVTIDGDCKVTMTGPPLPAPK